jgi:hypothetical protein
MTLSWYMQPVRLISTIFWWTKFEISCKWVNKNNLDTFAIQLAAQYYSDGEISSGRFRELARDWAAGINIGPQLKILEEYKKYEEAK